MISFFANIFGYLLNFLYTFIGNYGVAIIVFSIVLKLILLPLSIKQQKTMKKTARVQEKLKELQTKYKSNPEKLNQETVALYKTEKMSPLSGCLGAIVQIVLLFSVFYLVRSPLTYMKKVDPQIIENYKNEIVQEQGEEKAANNYPEIEIIEKKGKEDEIVYVNMEFLGLNLSKVPTQNFNDIQVYIIPILYVISSFISLRLTTNMQKRKQKSKEIIVSNGEEKEQEQLDPADAVAQANKSMSYIMPLMSISIALIAPLGLALYWLVNNILMIIERLTLNKLFEKEEDEENA